MFVHAILVTKSPTVVLTSMTLPNVPNRTWSGKSLGSWVESLIFPYIVVIVTRMQTCNVIIFVMQTLCMGILNNSILNHKFQTFILSTTRVIYLRALCQHKTIYLQYLSTYSDDQSLCTTAQ